MGFIKCPRCELNYIQDTEDYCEVCKRELRTKFSHEDEPEALELCAECNERPALPGEELCAICKRENMDSDEEDDILESPLTISDMSEMEEIELDDDIPDDIDDEDSVSEDEDIDDIEEDDE